ncbi:conserved hypothetical protein [Frankia sp. Hr75.2]|nr:conserved hypothetical protein [Frankia sp. Hr75.2]
MSQNAQPPGGGIPRAVRESLAGGRTSHSESNPRPTRADIELARLRARLRYIAHAAGRPLRSRLDEAEHSAARRAGEVARMKVVGE